MHSKFIAMKQKCHHEDLAPSELFSPSYDGECLKYSCYITFSILLSREYEYTGELQGRQPHSSAHSVFGFCNLEAQ
jgi:hypothetical protein